jgi:hypothetical protein
VFLLIVNVTSFPSSFFSFSISITSFSHCIFFYLSLLLCFLMYVLCMCSPFTIATDTSTPIARLYQNKVMLFLYFHLLYLPFFSYLFICNPRQVPHSNTVNRTACFRMSGLPLYVTQLSNHQQYTHGRTCKLWLNNKCAIYFTDKADCIREKLLNA